jgi:excisionase family DNA binding protein
MFSYPEIAEMKNIPLSTLYYYYRQGTGPKTAKIGRHLRVSEDDLERWVETTTE